MSESVGDSVQEPFPDYVVDSPGSPPTQGSPFVRRHRRSRETASAEDVESFRRSCLGLEKSELDQAFEQAEMSLTGNNGGGNAAAGGSNSGGGLFNFFDNNNTNASNASGMSASGRASPLTPTPTASTGNGAPAGMMPSGPGVTQSAGHQMDLNHVYSMVLELSEVLKNNREMTRGIINGAGDLMRRAEAEGTSPTLQEANGEITGAHITELERALAKEKRRVDFYKREQDENWKLINEYEEAVGKMTEQIRNYCCNNESHFLAQKRHYNNLLQAERDAHLKSRLERDHWHAETMKLAGMIRKAYRLRCQEDEVPIRVVSGLQNEVRCLRNALGLEPERPEEEYGWEILKDAPPSVD